MVAQQSLNLFVMVRIHVGQPFAGTEIFEILLADFRPVFRAFVISAFVFKAFIVDAASFRTPIPCDACEKTNGSKPLRLKGPRTLRRV